VVLNILKLQVNLPLTDQQFQLETPAGANVIDLGAANHRPMKPAQKKDERAGSGN